MSRIATLTEEQKKLLSKPMSDEISLIDKTAAESKKAVSENYEVQKAETEKEYNGLYDQNNVQRIINERRIAENMANLGLTDSGLNRTQQTAAQLSYANNQNRLSIAKQKAVDDLARVMNAKLNEIDTTRAQNEQSIRSAYSQKAVENATSIYNAEQDAAAKVEEARISAQNKLTSAKQTARNNLIAILTDDTKTAEAKQVALDNYGYTYGIDDDDYNIFKSAGYNVDGKYGYWTAENSGVEAFKKKFSAMPLDLGKSGFVGPQQPALRNDVEKELKKWASEGRLSDEDIAELIVYYKLDK